MMAHNQEPNGQGMNDGFSKPSYDARLKFYSVVQNIMMAISIAQAEGELQAWHRLARNLFSMCKPYIKPEDAQTIMEAFAEIKRDMNLLYTDEQGTPSYKTNPVWEAYIDNQLQEVQDMIYESAKHMLLPIKEEDDDDMDMDSFESESDV